jgi:hypothetical protein
MSKQSAATPMRMPTKRSRPGVQRLGGISRAGDERLRQLLVLEATAVIQYTKPGRPATSPWLLNLLSPKPRKLGGGGASAAVPVPRAPSQGEPQRGWLAGSGTSEGLMHWQRRLATLFVLLALAGHYAPPRVGRRRG